ncbi:unnamed protein product [Alopecurus aequalis]
MECVDAKRLQRPTMPGDLESKVLDDDSTSSWQVPATPLEDEDLLHEILLRLPSKPSSLPRASLVCLRWRNILSDPQFLRRFRKHHGKPPLLGFFNGTVSSNFVPVLDTKPDCIPANRFATPKRNSSLDHWDLLDCRHGLVVLIHQLVKIYQLGRKVFVWDPLTKEQRCLSFPAGLRKAEKDTSSSWHAAVLWADAEDGHMHGDCLSSLFKVILICRTHGQTFACLYDSRIGVWGNISSTATTSKVSLMRSSILIGNTIYWLLYGGDILEFDIDRQTLVVIEKPKEAHRTDCWSFQLWRTYGGSCLGLAVMLKPCIQLWKRNSNCDDVEWVLLQKIVQLEGLIPLGVSSGLKGLVMAGYDEDSNIIVVGAHYIDFMLQLESMQFSSISKGSFWCDRIHIPYRNFYTLGNSSVPCT